MGVVYHRYQKEPLLSCRNAMNALALAFFAFAAQNFTVKAQPVLSPPVLVNTGFSGGNLGQNDLWTKMTVSNCFPGYAQYLLQMSTNLTDWSTLTNFSSTGSNVSLTVPRVNASTCFYRLGLPSALGILCKSNLNMQGNNASFDSFDSSTAAGGQWSVAGRQANVNVAAYKFLNVLNIGNANIYGFVYTSPGLATNVAQVGRNGSVGDLGWVSTGTKGIETGHWQTNLNFRVPDVVAPNITGWLTNFPAATNGVIMLTKVGASYVVSPQLMAYPLVVTAPTTIWVQGSAAIGVTISNATWVAGGVTNTSSGQLALYVGNTSGVGDSLLWSGQGTCNVPGYAANLQIFGLPSLTSIDFHGNASWIAAVYAPEAAVMVGGGGNNVQDSMGTIVCNTLTLNGHWNFHFDQHLSASNIFP